VLAHSQEREGGVEVGIGLGKALAGLLGGCGGMALIFADVDQGKNIEEPRTGEGNDHVGLQIA